MSSPTQIGITTYQADARPPSITRFLGFLVTAGLINASIAAYLLCPLPQAHHPSLLALFVRALFYVAGAALAGMAGAWFYWSRPSNPFRANPPLSFRLFVLTNAVAWVWVPAVLLLSAQDSPASACIAILAAALAATGLRKAVHSSADTLRQHEDHPPPEQRELFADTLRTPPREIHGYVIAVCIYFASFELHDGSNLDSSAILALCAFFIAWKLTLAPDPAQPAGNVNSRAVRRLAKIASAAVFVTVFTLLFGVASRNRTEAARAGLARAHGGDANRNAHAQAHNPGSAISGYESIILWPIPEKKQILPPLPQPTSLLAPGTTKPLVIRFDGPYWYFQPPGKRPTTDAHQAHGTPTDLNIRARNFIPLVMEAHQSLGTPIPIARCREIQVDVLNNDNQPGVINLAVLLTDTSASGKPQLYLGQQPLQSTQSDGFTIKTDPTPETLRFSVPTPAKIRKFDQITIMFFPSGANYDQGSKVAIQQFQLIPR
ncbi:MAG TPA: hypothetical protein VGG56_13730 [Terracidiphilus sp.]|jgi:hypothetical protein